MPKSFYLGTDHELYTGGSDFSAKITASPGAFGLDSSQCVAYAAVNAAYASAYEASQDPATRTKAKISAKNQARANLRKATADLARIIDGTATVTDEQKIELGLNVRASSARVPPPGVAPVAEIIGVNGHLVSVRVRDGETPSRRGKPAGVLGANVYSFVGATYPTDPSGWEFQGATTKRTLDVLFPDSVPAGSQVWICATWFNPTVESGPVSTPVTTFIQHGMSMAA
jgi:hypothetical protein